MRKFLKLSGVAILGIAVVCAAPAGAAPGPERAVLAGSEAVLVAPPEFVTEGEVAAAEWSSSGRFVLASRSFMRLPDRVEAVEQAMREIRIEQSVVLYDAQSRTSTELFKVQAGSETRPEIGWLHGTDTAFVVTNYWRKPVPVPVPGQAPPQPERWLFRVDAGRKAMRPLYRVVGDTRLHVAPESALAVLFNREEKLLQVLKPDGQPRQVVAIPAGTEPLDVRWSQDGRTLLVDCLVPTGQGEGEKFKAGIFALDVTKGALAPVSMRPAPYRPQAPEGVLRLRHSHATLQEGKAKQPLRPLWLESTSEKEPERVLVAPDAQWGRLSPRGDAVLYVNESGAFVAPFVRVAREPFLQARAAAMRAVALSNAKQVGLALNIYAQDHGGQLPAAGQPVEELLRPLVGGNARIFEGLVYTHPGGKLTDIATPATTVLGYIQAPEGRVQIFADGHVELARD